MNENWNQEPYVSSGNYGQREDQANILSAIASRSFLVVFIGMIITTISAYLTARNTSFVYSLAVNNTFWIFAIAEVVAVIACSYAVRKNNMSLAVTLFAVYTVLNGITLSTIFLIYDIGAIQEAFLLTTILFGVVAAYGYFTKKDLSRVGSIGMMALVGVIIVSLANVFFFHSSGMDLLIDYITVLIFVGLTAFDMYRMRQMASGAAQNDIMRIAMFTGIQLYLDFINLFIRLVSIMGRRD